MTHVGLSRLIELCARVVGHPLLVNSMWRVHITILGQRRVKRVAQPYGRSNSQFVRRDNGWV